MADEAGPLKAYANNATAALRVFAAEHPGLRDEADAPEDYEAMNVPRTYRAPIPPPVLESGTIPLDEQVRLYEARFERELDRLWDALADPVYTQHIHDLGLARLKAGFDIYGDDAFHWSDACREQNADEELADFLVYCCTEPGE